MVVDRLKLQMAVLHEFLHAVRLYLVLWLDGGDDLVNPCDSLGAVLGEFRKDLERLLGLEGFRLDIDPDLGEEVKGHW